jgi:hypothetical protein
METSQEFELVTGDCCLKASRAVRVKYGHEAHGTS